LTEKNGSGVAWLRRRQMFGQFQLGVLRWRQRFGDFQLGVQWAGIFMHAWLEEGTGPGVERMGFMRPVGDDRGRDRGQRGWNDEPLA
jgi:hypothetical protein